MGAAAGEGPADHAWLRLFRVPAGGLFGTVVGAAGGVQVALVGWAVGIRDDVVLVGVERLRAAPDPADLRDVGAIDEPEADDALFTR